MVDISRFSVIRQRFESHGQGHVFAFFDTLSVSEQETLLGQLEAIKVERLARDFAQAMADASKGPAGSGIEPLHKGDIVKVEDAKMDGRLLLWHQKGLQLFHAGKVATVVLAGGQGTRLGSKLPKGCFNIGLPSSKSLFQLQAERLLRLAKVSEEFVLSTGNTVAATGSAPAWYIMTSAPTHADTIGFFEENGYFGLCREQVRFFQQGVLPALDENGRIILQSKNQVSFAPDGNGGIYAAMANSGVLDEMARNGVEYVHMYCVDNCLVRPGDPTFVGFCAESGTDCAAKAVSKLSPSEPVGVFCRMRKGGTMGVAEYSELDPAMATETGPDGQLIYGAANIANHFFTLQFLLKQAEGGSGMLPFHIARKKIPAIDLGTGEPITVSGIKLEAFIFDVFGCASRPILFQINRAEEFAPLKNGPNSSSDNAVTCCQNLYNLHASWLTRAGATIIKSAGAEGDHGEATAVVEISPLLSYSGEGLERYRDAMMVSPIKIDESQ